MKKFRLAICNQASADQVPVNAETVHLGTGTTLSDLATNQGSKIGVYGFDKEAINNNGLPSGGVQRRAGSLNVRKFSFLEVTPSEVKWRFPLNS